MIPVPKPAELSLDQCLKCNICVAVCPVSAVTDLFPGPKYEGPQAGRFRMPGQPTPDQSVDYCSGCRVCNMACPAGVKIAEMNARARHVLVEQGKFSPRLRLRNNLIARTELLGKFGQPLAPLTNALLRSPIVRRLAEAALGIARDAPLPPFAREKFTSWWHQQTSTLSESHPKEIEKGVRVQGKKVVYFHGCSTEYYEPRIGRAAVGVLEAIGFEVIIPPQNCCGLPLLSNGEFEAARKLHQNNVASLVQYARQGIPIVGTSTSCTLTLKEEAPDLLDMHDEETRLVAENTYDFNEFILKLWREGNLPGIEAGSQTQKGQPTLNSVPLTLGYHAPCQYRAHRLGNPAVEVLNLIPGLKIIESHVDCCGIAGTYGYKKEKADISKAVGQPLFEFIQQVGAPLAVCDSETCRWQITFGTGTPAIHPVELLAAAYGLETEEPLRGVLQP